MSKLQSKIGYLPTFIHIGGQRCGTTWLYRCLGEHPEIFTPETKEIGYFVGNYEKGKEWYLEHFQPGAAHKAWGEATPWYLSWILEEESVPERVASLVPGCKLICCLRDPTERAFSQWKTFLRDQDGPSFRRAVEENIGKCLTRGLYARHLKRWFEYFPREQFLIQFHGEVVQNNERALREVFEFLEVDPAFVPSLAGKSYNALIFPDVQRNLQKVGLGWAVQMVRGSALGTLIRKWHQSGSAKQNAYRAEMSEDVRRKLDRYYAEPNRELERLLGATLQGWPT